MQKLINYSSSALLLTLFKNQETALMGKKRFYNASLCQMMEMNYLTGIVNLAFQALSYPSLPVLATRSIIFLPPVVAALHTLENALFARGCYFGPQLTEFPFKFLEALTTLGHVVSLVSFAVAGYFGTAPYAATAAIALILLGFLERNGQMPPAVMQKFLSYLFPGLLIGGIFYLPWLDKLIYVANVVNLVLNRIAFHKPSFTIPYALTPHDLGSEKVRHWITHPPRFELNRQHIYYQVVEENSYENRVFKALQDQRREILDVLYPENPENIDGDVRKLVGSAWNVSQEFSDEGHPTFMCTEVQEELWEVYTTSTVRRCVNFQELLQNRDFYWYNSLWWRCWIDPSEISEEDKATMRTTLILFDLGIIKERDS